MRETSDKRSRRPKPKKGPPVPTPPAGKPKTEPPRPKEIGGRDGPEPTRYGDWEVNGICVDF